jgi:deazaflavin-dependent oxidoreductase (nitroreductase family)
MRDRTARNLSTLHAALYHLTRGRIGRRLVNNDILLLTTNGRHTGKPHTVPLLYLREGEQLVVIASWGGRDNHPEWYKNLVADPNVDVQINGASSRMLAATAGPMRRAALWPRVLDAYDGYREYQGRTEREIPIVVLQDLS